MMTNRVSYGKPDAGKPHVRFDEGEVASATPRRGSLLYKCVSKLASWCVGSALVTAAMGESAYWTGAADSCWTNAANWVDANGAVASVPPGILEPVDGDTGAIDYAGVAYETAVFDRASAHTTIDLEGLRVIRNVTVKGSTTPVYTFGTGAAQTLRLLSEAQAQSYKNGGVFLIDSDVVNMPVLAAVLSGEANGTINEGFHVRNNATGTLNVNMMGRLVNAGAARWSAYPENIYSGGSLPNWAVGYPYDPVRFVFDGTGPTVFHKGFTETGAHGGGLTFDSANGGTYSTAEGAQVTNVTCIAITKGVNFNLAAGSRLVMAPTSAHATDFTHSGGANANFTGEGELVFYWSSTRKGPAYLYGPNTLTLASRFTVTNDTGAGLADVPFYYCGVNTSSASRNKIVFAGENTMPGAFVYNAAGYFGPILKTATIGADGSGGTLGYGSLIQLANGGALVYAGAGETSSRTLDIVAGSAEKGGATMTLEQAGTGTWRVQSLVTQECAAATLTLKNATAAEAIFEAPLGGVKHNGADTVLNIVKTGSGDWELDAENRYTGTTTVSEGTLRLGRSGTIAASSQLILAGGALEVTGGATAEEARQVTLPPVEVNSGTEISDLCVTGYATVSIAQVTQTSGILNICTTDAGGQVKLTGLAGGTMPSWIRYNGISAAIDAEGNVIAGQMETTAQIPARGGVIPNDAAAVVGITTPGEAEAGPITLAADETAVDVLAQQTTTNAVVSLAGKKLTANTLLIDILGAVSLDVGAAPGEGTVAAGSGTAFVLENEATNGAVLTVGATLDVAKAKDIIKRGPGDVKLTAPLTHTGNLTIDAGALIVSNATTIAGKLKGAGTFVKEGNSDFAIPTTAYPDFTGAIVLTGGTNNLPDNGLMAQKRAFKVCVKDGASLNTSGGWYDTGVLPVEVEGTGPDGAGAIYMNISGNARAFPFLTLTGDTVINPQAGWFGLGGGRYSGVQGVFNMNGHTLTKPAPSGSGCYYFEKGCISNAGPIVLESAVGAQNIIEIFAGYDMGEGARIEVGDRGLIYLKGPKPINRPLKVTGSDVLVRAYGDTTLSETSFGCGRHVLNGAVEVEKSTDSLSIYGVEGEANWRLDLNGPLQGAGTLQIGRKLLRDGTGTVHIASQGSTFTGTLTTLGNADGASSFTVEHPDFVPATTYANVTFEVVPPRLPATNWTDAAVMALAQAATFKDGANPLLWVPVGETVTRESCALKETADVAIEVAGGGTFNVTGTTVPLAFTVGDARVKVTGEKAIQLGTMNVRTGTLAIDGAANVELGLDAGECISIGNRTGTTPARMVLKDACALAREVTEGNQTEYRSEGANASANYRSRAIIVGDKGPGVLEIGAGAAVTNRIIIGGASGGYGAVYQTGGYFATMGNAGDNQCASGSAGTTGAYGYRAVTGGTYHQMGCNNEAIGGGGLGVTYVSGAGRITMGKRPAACDPQPSWTPSYNIPYNGHAVFQIENGGQINLAPCNILSCRTGSDNSLAITVEGEGSLFRVSNMFAFGYAGGKGRGYINMNDGGVFEAPYVNRNRDVNVAGYGDVHIYINFNGGTFRAVTSGYNLFGDKTHTAASQSGALVDAVTLYEKGGTIEVGAGKTVYADKIRAASGNGVAAIDATAIADKTYLGSPRIEISGDGWGASAYALFDSDSGKVTGIKVTSAGCDYTTATATVKYGKEADVTLPVTLAANATTGALTKDGAGVLVLTGTNTFTGPVVVKSGTLKAQTDGAFASGTPLVLAGGTLDLNNYAFTFAGVSGNGGTLKNGSLVIGGDWRFDCARIVAGEKTQVTGDVAISAGTRLLFDNSEELTEKGPYAFFEVTGTLTGKENLSVEAPAGWMVKTGSQAFRLVKARATVLIVR